MRKLILSMIIVMALLLSGCDGTSNVKTGLNPGLDTIEINEPWIDGGAYFIAGEEHVIVFSEDSVDETTLGEYTITYTFMFEDEEYNVTRMVIVLDQTAPILSILEGVDTIEVDELWIDGGCEVTDNSGETLTCSTESVVDMTIAGSYEVIYAAEDSSGNEGTITRIVVVE